MTCFNHHSKKERLMQAQEKKANFAKMFSFQCAFLLFAFKIAPTAVPESNLSKFSFLCFLLNQVFRYFIILVNQTLTFCFLPSLLFFHQTCLICKRHSLKRHSLKHILYKSVIRLRDGYGFCDRFLFWKPYRNLECIPCSPVRIQYV